ncbi:antibiotic biosynthesis monooxygenase [Frondihabitans peucedani]|uniref:Antibiotic biosynthesis monooxygenase n=1 Tax=Frondihabitans peucedani TaxID=598626 RepID=A0ABP8E107_9MICO
MSSQETRNTPRAPRASGTLPVTVAITRIVRDERIPEVTRWVQAGVNLANRHPGFLGSGWVRAHGESDEWHMLYRFADRQTLDDWEQSADRQGWLAEGRDLVVESRVERRTGIEGWFDSAEDGAAFDSDHQGAGSPPPPPRWKQATSIWVGFFPVNLVFTYLTTLLVPGWSGLAILPRVLITTLTLTPIMAYWVLPLATRLLRPWLHAPRRSRAGSPSARPGVTE